MNIRAQIFGGMQVETRLLKAKQPKRTRALTDVPIEREETRRTNNRDEDRHRLTGHFARVDWDGRMRDVEVVNVSGGGAMISADLVPNIGDRIHLYLAGEDAVECAVRWIKGGRLGLEFAHETQLRCSPAEQSAVLREVVQRTFPEASLETVAVADEPAEPDEQRAAMRHPLIWSGDLHYGSHSWRVRLRNISTTGALIECTGALRTDAEVVLDLKDAGALVANVSWIAGDHVGLQFWEPFDLRLLSQSTPRVVSASWLKPAYLEDEVEDDSSWDASWNRLSVNQLKEQLEGYLKR
jgi:hypothetical protein